MIRAVRIFCIIVPFGLLAAAAFSLARGGAYGWTLFVLVPFLAGATGTVIRRPKSAVNATGVGAIVGLAGCGVFLLAGSEGLICIVMAIPLIVPIASAGSLFAYWVCNLPQVDKRAEMLFLIPFSLFFEQNARPPVYKVTTSVVIHAAPERVWEHVLAFPDIASERDWVLRTGLAYPLRTRIEGAGVGAPRSCDLSTGTVRERVVVWDEPRLLRFTVTATPPAMKEMGLYGPIHPRHLNGYYISRQGQFELKQLPDGGTLLIGTSWYQHGLWPAEYWRWWSDMTVHHIHERVLEHIRQLSEAAPTGATGKSGENPMK